MNRKFTYAFILLAGLAVTTILPYCNSEHDALPAHHAFLESGEFKNMNRAEQIQQCASCHNDIFQNEMIGPHANAYEKLLDHIEYINSELYDCEFYTAHVNKSYDQCAGCHAPQNLLETFLLDTFKTPELHIKNLLAIANPRPKARVDESIRATSIDCLSCHYDGKQLRSLKHVLSEHDSIAERQTLEVITVNNLSCYVCHSEVVRSIEPQIAINRTGSVRCVSCHQEYDHEGKGTHYFYWQHDLPHKNNKKIAMLLDDFDFSILPDNKTGMISWQNTMMPHQVSSGPEMIFLCDVLDVDSAVLGSTTVRVNLKRKFDKVMYSAMNNNYHHGTEGDEVPLDGQPRNYTFEIANAEQAAIFRISFIHKSQYWFHDSLGVVSVVKHYPVKNNPPGKSAL